METDSIIDLYLFWIEALLSIYSYINNIFALHFIAL